MMKAFLVPLLFLSVLLSASAQTKSSDRGDPTIPHLRIQGTATQLIVDGSPFLMLAGELGNSSASDLEYMNPILPKLVKMHLNTVLVPVYWELLEPREGVFDFTLVDSAIHGARQHNLRLVFLWFGTWKNSMSCYAPYWVKTDVKRFPRARTAGGTPEEIVTPFSNEGMKADARAFAALMKHIRAVDRTQHTVVMIQVENEIGMIPDARDHYDLANKAFSEQVPSELMTYLVKNKGSLTSELAKLWGDSGFKGSGTWEEAFGKSLQAEEVFMAWYFARYTNEVAEAGKSEYPLTMYVNAALIRPGYTPGQYPSAGPLPHLFDIWRAAAPAIEFLAPDIYFKNFAEWIGKYDRHGNPMFIPEAESKQSIANAFYAFARHNAMGYSPFSIESLDDPEGNQVSRGYAVLQQLLPLIIEHQGKGTMAGVLLDSANQTERVQLGHFTFTFRHEYGWKYAVRSGVDTPRVGGLIIMLSPEEFLVAGSGIIVTFASNTKDSVAGIASIDEGKFVAGKWIAGRRMNGDQSHQGRHMHLPGGSFGIQRVKLYKYW
jgi:beta-galactosidase GanA